MQSTATIWSADSIQPVPTPVPGSAPGLTREPTLQVTQRKAARKTGRLASTHRAVTGTTVPDGRTVSGRPERSRASFSVDLPRMSVV